MVDLVLPRKNRRNLPALSRPAAFTFGSALRGELRQDSDIDVLVEFEPDAVIGFKIGALENELAALFGRKVDLRTPAGLSRYFRQGVLETARPIYERAG